jgi:hypothetical protein
MEVEYQRLVGKLAGAWRLLSSEFTNSRGDVFYPLGEDAQGQVIFTQSGYMSGQLLRKGRPVFSSGNQASGTPEEIKDAFEGFVSYYGPFELDLGKHKLITHVEGSLFPNWVGGDQERFFELHEDRLILKTTPIAIGNDEFVGVLIWQRK